MCATANSQCQRQVADAGSACRRACGGNARCAGACERREGQYAKACSIRYNQCRRACRGR
jgi:hypothetical protein